MCNRYQTKTKTRIWSKLRNSNPDIEDNSDWQSESDLDGILNFCDVFFSFEVSESECDVIGGQWWRLQCQSFSHASSTKDTFEQYEELRTSICNVQLILYEASIHILTFWLSIISDKITSRKNSREKKCEWRAFEKCCNILSSALHVTQFSSWWQLCATELGQRKAFHASWPRLPLLQTEESGQAAKATTPPCYLIYRYRSRLTFTRAPFLGALVCWLLHPIHIKLIIIGCLMEY